MIGGKFVFFFPPFLIVRRIGFPMPRKVVSNDIEILGNLGIFQKPSPLMVMATGCVLADKRNTLTILQIKNFILAAINVNCYITSSNW